jgi:hypothetical protein
LGGGATPFFPPPRPGVPFQLPDLSGVHEARSFAKTLVPEIRRGIVNYAALFRSALVALLRNKMRSVLTVLGITIGIAAVICVVAIGKAGQARVEQQLNNLGDDFVWIEAGGRAVNGRSKREATPWNQCPPSTK